jgi:hypothetical protein
MKRGEHDETNSCSSAADIIDIQSSGFGEENLGHSNVKDASISNDKDDSNHDTEVRFNLLSEKKNALHSGISRSNAIGTISMTLPEADEVPKRRLSTPSAIRYSSETEIQVRRSRGDNVCMQLSFVRLRYYLIVISITATMLVSLYRAVVAIAAA